MTLLYKCEYATQMLRVCCEHVSGTQKLPTFPPVLVTWMYHWSNVSTQRPYSLAS